MAEPGPYRLLGFGLAAAILIADQISKYWIIAVLQLPMRGLIEVTSFFNLRWVENYGVSMGFLVAGSNRDRWLLVAATAAIAIGITIWLWREKGRPDAIALALVLGGAMGNIVDRTRLGYVADFLGPHIGGWYPFLVFNVADAAITIGVVILVLRALLARERKAPAENIDAV